MGERSYSALDAGAWSVTRKMLEMLREQIQHFRKKRQIRTNVNGPSSGPRQVVTPCKRSAASRWLAPGHKSVTLYEDRGAPSVSVVWRRIYSKKHVRDRCKFSHVYNLSPPPPPPTHTHTHARAQSMWVRAHEAFDCLCHLYSADIKNGTSADQQGRR